MCRDGEENEKNMNLQTVIFIFISLQSDVQRKD